MAQSPLSSVMLIASDGLIQNQGLAISGNLAIAINAYTSTDVVNSYMGVMSSAVANLGIGNNQVGSNTITLLQSLGSNTLPAVTNVIPSDYANTLGPLANTYAGGFSGLVTTQAQSILGNGDLSKFCQTYGIVQSYIVQTNQYINTVKNSAILAPTFSTMDALTTGSIGEINRTLTPFGADLIKLGQAWNLNNLPFFGYPWVLLKQVITLGGLLPELLTKLNTAGVSTADIGSFTQNDTTAVSSEIDAAIYKAMKTVTGDLLSQINLLLDVTTPNITTMADLLNPIKTLPNSYLGLTILAPTGTDITPTATVLSNVYIQADTVNSNLLVLFAQDPAYIDLARVTPPDQALANRAIATSLGQIKNIFNLTLPAFAAAVSAIESNTGLPAINALKQPVPTSVVNSLNSTLATGTGPNGTLTLFDFMGSAAGIPYTALFNQSANTINGMSVSSAFTTLIDPVDGAYTIMQNTIDGMYTIVVDPGPPEIVTVTIPAGLPGEGVYNSVDEAFGNGIVPATSNLIANVVSSFSSQSASLNSDFNTMASQLAAEKINLAAAQVNFADLSANSRPSLLSLGTSLHQIGQDVAPKGSAEFFAAIADTSNIYGQAIISSMREGRNITAMNAAGIGSDTQIPIA